MCSEEKWVPDGTLVATWFCQVASSGLSVVPRSVLGIWSRVSTVWVHSCEVIPGIIQSTAGPLTDSVGISAFRPSRPFSNGEWRWLGLGSRRLLASSVPAGRSGPPLVQCEYEIIMGLIARSRQVRRTPVLTETLTENPASPSVRPR